MKSRGYGLLVTLVALVLALGISACGGGDSSSSTNTTQSETLSRADFVKRANSLCAEAKKETEKRFNIANKWVPDEGVPARPLREKIIRFMVLEPTTTVSRELQKLVIRGGEEKVESYADLLGEELDQAEQTPLTVAEGIAFVESDELAQEVGLSRCTF